MASVSEKSCWMTAAATSGSAKRMITLSESPLVMSVIWPCCFSVFIAVPGNLLFSSDSLYHCQISENTDDFDLMVEDFYQYGKMN